MKQGQGAARIVGAPVTYGLAIPSRASHPDAAAGFAAFLFGDSGRRLFERRGFIPSRPRSVFRAPAFRRFFARS
jgi:ABC-type molybdate transport system substrate-binding protein